MKLGKAHFSHLPSQEKYFRALVGSLFNPNAQEKIIETLKFSKQAHEQQFRDEGAAYIIHPIRAACTLLELAITTPEVISATLLHDVAEDTGISIEEIKKRFGKRVSILVKNVTRLRPINESEKEKREAKIEKYKEYLSADYETRLIKCADMLDNIRSWSVIPKSHPSRNKFARWYAEVEHYSIPIAEKTNASLAHSMREAFAAAKACADK